MFDAPQYVVCSLGCQDTQLPHTGSALASTPRPFSAGLLSSQSSPSLYPCSALLCPRCRILVFRLTKFHPICQQERSKALISYQMDNLCRVDWGKVREILKTKPCSAFPKKSYTERSQAAPHTHYVSFQEQVSKNILHTTEALSDYVKNLFRN